MIHVIGACPGLSIPERNNKPQQVGETKISSQTDACRFGGSGSVTDHQSSALPCPAREQKNLPAARPCCCRMGKPACATVRRDRLIRNVATLSVSGAPTVTQYFVPAVNCGDSREFRRMRVLYTANGPSVHLRQRNSPISLRADSQHPCSATRGPCRATWRHNSRQSEATVKSRSQLE